MPKLELRHEGKEIDHRSPAAIFSEIAALDAESAEALGNIRGLLK